MDRLEELKVVELGEKIGYKKGFEAARKQFERPHGKWRDYSNEGYVECPFCEHATNCEDNIEELHYCFFCGASMISSNTEIENPCKTCTKYIGNMCEHVCEKRYEYVMKGGEDK